ncbi:hypothetical protein ACGFH8_07905 [Micromonospora sp. NPDC049175]|uniref:hypothetical protein n=1 Tax=Micromonospora sp. NPDC049175 TaxID=3364266 RepID=UPI00371FD643
MKRRERLHRNTARLRRDTLVCGVFGALVWGAAQAVMANPNHRYYNKAPLFEFFSVVIVAFSLIALLALLWPFLIEVDDEGLTLRLRGSTTRLPWESVESLAVVKIGERWESANLDVRLTPGVRLRGRLASKKDGRRTYTPLSLDEFTVAPEEVIAVLQRYGRGRVDAQEYLQIRAARRAVARYMLGDVIQADQHLAEYMAEQRRVEVEESGPATGAAEVAADVRNAPADRSRRARAWRREAGD